MLGPIRRRSLRIVILQGLRVVLAFVAEQAAEFFEVRRARDQAVPVVVPDLVAKVAEQRAVRFAHLPAAAFAFGVVGFREIDRDHAAGVTGQHRPPIGCGNGIAEKLECQSLGTLRLGGERKAKLKQGIEQAMLGDLDGTPVVHVLRQRQIRDRPVVAARRAIEMCQRRRKEPVAHGVRGIGAEPIVLLVGERPPGRLLRVARFPADGERRHGLALWQIAERRAAALAACVLEMQQLAALLALKQLHCGQDRIV
jgi:hypothetical protein